MLKEANKPLNEIDFATQIFENPEEQEPKKVKKRSWIVTRYNYIYLFIIFR